MHPARPLPSRRARGTLAVALVAALTLLAGPLAPPAQAAPDPVIDALITKRLDNPRLGSDVALLAIDAATGEVLTDHNAGTPMRPASNMKVVTAVTALAAMGPDTRFTTRVRAGATPADLVLEGGADPLLTTAELQKLARQTAKTLAPGTAVTVHVDDDVLPDTGRARGWPRHYVPSVAASVEGLARLWDYSVDPSANAAGVFVDELNRRGVVATLGPDADAGEGAVIAESPGHTVAEAVRVMLRISENNVAEILHRQVARAVGLPATWAGATQAAEQVLRNLGVDPTGMALKDGSGLSRKDRVSPAFLVNVLRVARVTNPAPFTVMFEPDAMPISGVSGTLDSRYGRFVTKQSRCAKSVVRAKTGTLFDTIGLSGVATSTAGSERVFSILVNDRPQRYSALSTRQAVDGLAATIVGCWD